MEPGFRVQSGSLEDWETQEEEENVPSGYWVHSGPAASMQGLHFPGGAVKREHSLPGCCSCHSLLNICRMNWSREKEEKQACYSLVLGVFKALKENEKEKCEDREQGA